MNTQVNPCLLLGAVLSGLAALAHCAIVVGGPAWYRFFGAGEGMARAAQAGLWMPAVVTLAIAAVLGVWSAYALSGAGVIGRLPMLKPVLVIVTGVYLLRGSVGALFLLRAGEHSTTFVVWSSLICLCYGLVHAAGLARSWSKL